ncbi:hypothetical protein GOBAR_AA03707 [Gossypium barbadense]|uniref:Uncharacterized protein n=1 Tax=Gossypium barbadense TaxID=3634 RepID=A0A2P5YMP7_GOSBA|nr:hypothetical protein GOBAR_AA03707 [Gossypium barbadense]
MSGTLPTMDFAASANNSTSTNGIGRAMNKVHTRPKVKLDFDNPTMDNNDHRIQSEISKASYKSTLLRASSKKNNGGFLEEEFTLLDGEAVTEVMEGVPSDESDYNKALVGGLWLIFGIYLILRQWSLEFSTSQSGIESQVVWIRLPGLTEVCVDLRKPLVSKVQINGHLHRVEYEYLPNICFHCALGVSEGEIFTVFNSEINESEAVVTKERSKDVIETKGKQAKLRAKGKKVVMGSGPKSTLKVLKSNNGSLGINLNIRRGAFDGGSRLAQVGATDKGKAIVMGKVEISTNLHKKKHAKICILEKFNNGR